MSKIENHKIDQVKGRPRLKVLEIGPYSAVGGVSTHIKRLANLLAEFHEFAFVDESPRSGAVSEVFNLRSLNVLHYLKLIRSSDVVHIHSYFWWLRGFHIVIASLHRKKIVVTLHSHANLTNAFSIWLTRNLLSLVATTVVVNRDIATRLGLDSLPVASAFVPPDLDTEPALPEEIIRVVEENQGSKLIVSNAYKLRVHNKEDLYGLDLLIDVARKIKQDKKAYKIIFIVASSMEKHDLLEKYSKVVALENLQTQISIIACPISFVRLVQLSDLVVRATNTDGDALTIREAMYFNCPVLASDVVVRPAGTLLFRNRDANDLYDKIEAALESESEVKTEESDAKFQDSVVKPETLSFYQKRFLTLLNF